MSGRRAAVALAAIVVVAVASVAGTPAEARPRKPAFCPAHYIAHRGEDWNTPDTEDGVRAVQAAIDDPHAYGVESDAWETSDGQGLMQHSDDLPRDTDGTGTVHDHTLAYIQSHYTMNDGTVPESVPQYLHQVVHGREHAILHLKSTASGYDHYIDRQLTAARAHQFVRPMATTIAQATYFVRHGWITELLVSGVASAHRVAAVQASGVAAVLVVDTSDTATPASWFRPYLRAGVTTDYVAYSTAQNKLIDKYPFNRILSGDIAGSAALSGCPATRK